MNKDLSAFLNANAFQSNGASRFYGNYKGFQFSGNALGQQPSVAVAAYFDENTVAVVKEWLKNNARNYSLASKTVDNTGIGVTFTGFSWAKKMIAFINDIADYLATVSTPDSCSFCGEPLEGSLDKGEPIYIECNGNRYRIHENCYDNFVERAAQTDAEAAAAPGNYLKGALGMLLGSLAGGALFIGLYLLGFIAWIAPLCAAFLGSFLYAKFGGKNDKKKIIILWAVTVVVVGICIVAAIILDVYRFNAEDIAALEQMGLEFDFFEALKYEMETNDTFRMAVVSDTVIAAVFLIAADVYMTYIVLKTQKPKTTLIKRLN